MHLFYQEEGLKKKIKRLKKKKKNKWNKKVLLGKRCLKIIYKENDFGFISEIKDLTFQYSKYQLVLFWIF